MCTTPLFFQTKQENWNRDVLGLVDKKKNKTEASYFLLSAQADSQITVFFNQI